MRRCLCRITPRRGRWRTEYNWINIVIIYHFNSLAFNFWRQPERSADEKQMIAACFQTLHQKNTFSVSVPLGRGISWEILGFSEVARSAAARLLAQQVTRATSKKRLVGRRQTDNYSADVEVLLQWSFVCGAKLEDIWNAKLRRQPMRSKEDNTWCFTSFRGGNFWLTAWLPPLRDDGSCRVIIFVSFKSATEGAQFGRPIPCLFLRLSKTYN